ncbi:EAL domain-containing protein [Methylomonas sp. SURF-2]|uniref:EAL domain-containing protein n=1 Tax=Methylomonas subterranea TaxID=2952225 RepID=A0ABT1TJ09_9GAMM|nr:EAL domain-containing protein [Methylomonas sp. SURF-2]MCQ8105457.1 EAL domain-containing protein [Methylomonas sp. SURF-2]
MGSAKVKNFDFSRADDDADASARQIDRLKRLYELSLLMSGDPMEVFAYAARMIGELLAVKVVCLSEIQGDQLQFLSVYVQGDIFTNAGSCQLAVTPCATVEAAKDIRVIQNVAAQFPRAAFLRQHNAYSYCGFPALDNAGNVVAVTCLLDDKPRDFTEQDLELLRIIGQRIGMELERKRLGQQKEATLAALRASEQQNRLILDNAGDGIIILNEHGLIESFNRTAREMFGYAADTVLGRPAQFLFAGGEHADGDQAFDRLLKRVQKGGVIGATEILAYYADNSAFPVELSIACLPMAKRQLYTLIVRDITLRKHFEQKLSQTHTVFENTSEGIVITDTDNRIVAVNKALCAMTGYSQAELIGQRPSKWKSGLHDGRFFSELWRSLLQTGQWRGEIWNRHKSGEVIPMLENINVVRDGSGAISSYVAIMTDITGIKKIEERLSHLAHHDPLTGLANRILLEERVSLAMRWAEQQQHKMAVLFIDLDRFKNINDSFGHSVGDQLLKEVAKRLALAVRETDTVSRLGGDEFVVILGELAGPELAHAVAGKLSELLSRAIVADGREFIVTPSIGIAMYPEDASSIEDLFKHADTAMYHAKNQGRNNCQFYSAGLSRTVYENLMLESALRNAEERGELSVHFQPQFDMATGELIGAEALARWLHPELGLVSPAQFIALAEESGQIVKLGEWVVRNTCRQIKQWLSGGLKLDRVSVNVSALQIQRGNFAESVGRILCETGLEAGFLELEVTESFIIEAEQSLVMLDALRQMGVELAIDDFGTSYSSLKYLKRLPIQRLKIDQSFVRDIPNDPNSNAIARAVIAMASSLQLETVAEGIENSQQRDFLMAEGCRSGQGYFFGKPVPAAEFTRLYLAES